MLQSLASRSRAFSSNLSKFNGALKFRSDQYVSFNYHIHCEQEDNLLPGDMAVAGDGKLAAEAALMFYVLAVGTLFFFIFSIKFFLKQLINLFNIPRSYI